MEVVLLGTGSGDGWPNPFCDCASCASAAAEPRGQTAALVDGRLLLDCGPETPRAAVRAGRSLRTVQHLLITHDHVDHFGPAALLWRHWARLPQPVDVLGPAAVIEEARRWVGPDDPVRLRAVGPGEEFALGAYSVRTLPADHETETVLYDVTDAEGARLLYATDTGPLPLPALEATVGRAYDLVLLEETFGDRFDHGTGHLDLATFPLALAELRKRAAITDDTDVVAIHLSHHNPPADELARRLGDWGARVVSDGTVLWLGRGRDVATGPDAMRPQGTCDSSATVASPAPANRWRPQRVFLLGGARSGKSAAAEDRLRSEPSVVYVATSGDRQDDPDWLTRVAEHQARRPSGWHTVTTTELVGLLDDSGPPLLIDCLTLWLTALMDEVGGWDDAVWEATGRKDLTGRINELVAALRRTARHVVLVSNEVGAGIVPATPSGRRFRDELGRLNTRVAATCDEVLLVVAGQVLPLKRGHPLRTSSTPVPDHSPTATPTTATPRTEEV